MTFENHDVLKMSIMTIWVKLAKQKLGELERVDGAPVKLD